MRLTVTTMGMISGPSFSKPISSGFSSEKQKIKIMICLMKWSWAWVRFSPGKHFAHFLVIHQGFTKHWLFLLPFISIFLFLIPLNEPSSPMWARLPHAVHLQNSASPFFLIPLSLHIWLPQNAPRRKKHTLFLCQTHILGWPKYSFTFSITMYRKAQTIFLANPTLT